MGSAVRSSTRLFFWTPLAFAAVVGLLLLMVGPAAAGHDPRAEKEPGTASDAIGSACWPHHVRPSGASPEPWNPDRRWRLRQRRFVSLTPLIVLGLAALFSRSRVAPAAAITGRGGGRGLRMVESRLDGPVWIEHDGPTASRARGECVANVRGTAARSTGAHLALPDQSSIVLQPAAAVTGDL